MSAFIAKLNRAVFGLLCLAMVVVGGSEVFMRYVLNSPMTWSQEFAIYCSIWMIFLGAGHATLTNRHPKVDFIFIIIPEVLRKPYEIFRQLVAFVVAAVFVYYGIRLTGYPTLKSSALHIPYTYIYLALPASMALTMIYAAVNIVKILKNEDL